MSEALTPRQIEVFKAIKGFIDQHGYSPTFAEIGEITGLHSMASVHKHVHALELRGRITLRQRETAFRVMSGQRSIAIGQEHQVCCPKCRHSFVVTR